MPSLNGVSGTKRPLGRFRTARMALVLAWAAFWLHTALFPCCESFAAVFDHPDSVSQSASAAQPAHHSDKTHSERSDESPLCDDTIHAEPAINGAYVALPIDGSQLDLGVIGTSIASGLIAVNNFKKLAHREYHPPPSLSRYLQTQRLLI